MRATLITACAAGVALLSSGAAADDGLDEGTAVSELVVTAPADARRVTPPTLVVSSEELLVQQPRGLDEALDDRSGVAVRVNSRGEAVARVRGSEERQTQVFIDGAPAAVPWDGRFDLSLLPAGLIGAVEIVKGAAPIEYGTNTVAGVAALQTRRGSDARPGVTALAETGTLGFQNAAAVATWEGERAEATVAVGRLARDAQRVASLGDLAFNETGAEGRTNTDLGSWSGFLAGGLDLGEARARISLLHFTAERGIAPEGHLDPAVESPRFWRYPEIAFTQLTLNAEADAGAAVVRGVAWGQWFGQTVDAYRDASYSTLRGREVDEDQTFGGRLTLTHPLGPARLRWSASAQRSNHDQLDLAFPQVAPSLDRRFRQDLFSFGVESDHTMTRTVQATWGLGYDRAQTPLTGDKPAQGPMGAPALSGGIRWTASPELTVTATAGRRTRFPTARELFGEALGRFQPNPELEAETAWLTDLVFDWRRGPLSLNLNPFAVFSEGTISQRIVNVDGVARRQRFNLNGSTSYGADLTLRAELTPHVALEAGASLLDAHASGADGGERLPQRPSHELQVALEYERDQAMGRIEIRHIGEAVDLTPSGALGELPGAFVVDLRGSWPIVRRANGTRLDLTGAVDNLTDASILPQLGLPAPGRTLRIGLRLTS